MQHDDWSTRRGSLSPEPYFHLRRSDIPAPPLFDDRHYEHPPEPSLPPPPPPPEEAYRHRAGQLGKLTYRSGSMPWEPSNSSRSSANDTHGFWRSGDQWHNAAGPGNGSNAAWRRSAYESAGGWDVHREEERGPYYPEDPTPVLSLQLVGPYNQSDTDESVDVRSSRQQPRHYPSPPARNSWVRSSSPPPPFHLLAPPRQQQQQQQQQRSQQQQPQQQRKTDVRSQGTPSLDDIVKNDVDPSTLSRQTLEDILLADYTNSLNELELTELAPQVARLADRRRKELAASKTEELSDALLCQACVTLPRDCVYRDCGHLVNCMECAQKIKNTKNECPICRRGITSLLHIYTS